MCAMQRIMCKSKIHRARVTDANLDYEGSITIDGDLMDIADLVAYEKVQVYNVNNGTRAETYVIEGQRGSGEICVNGALARWAQKGDLLIIVAFGVMPEDDIAAFRPKMVLVDESNRVKKLL